MAFRYPECATCVWHDPDEAAADICDDCDEGSEYEPYDEDEYDSDEFTFERVISLKKA